MPIYRKAVEALALDCKRDIEQEFQQIRLQISSREIHKLAESLLCGNSPEWPLALIELQKGKRVNRLLDRLNLEVKAHGFLAESPFTFTGNFPTLSLCSLKAVVDEYRSMLQAAHWVELVGNKVWNYSLKRAAHRLLPFQINAASLTLNALGCSAAQQMRNAVQDIAARIKGCILNFLYDWETLLVRQTRQQLFILSQNKYLPVIEAAV